MIYQNHFKFKFNHEKLIILYADHHFDYCRSINMIQIWLEIRTLFNFELTLFIDLELSIRIYHH